MTVADLLADPLEAQGMEMLVSALWSLPGKSCHITAEELRGSPRLSSLYGRISTDGHREH